MKTDDICNKYSNNSVQLSLRMLDSEDGDSHNIVLIEGPSRALRMLSELLLAVADEPENDGFSISPGDAGSFHFASSSELGFYIYRLPD